MAEDSDNQRRRALMQARIIWAALVLGLGMIMVVLGVMIAGIEEGPAADAEQPMTWLWLTIAVLVFIACVVGAMVARKILPQAWQDGRFNAEAYQTRVVANLAPLEGAAVVAMVLALLDGQLAPVGLVALVALALMVVRFPTAAEVAGPETDAEQTP